MKKNYEIILEKILKHDYKFNELEKDYIMLNPTLKENFIKEMNKSDFVLNNDNINLILENSEYGTTELAYKVCDYLIKTNDPEAFHLIYEIKENIESDIAKSKIKNILDNYVKVDEKSMIFGFEELSYLIINKRYDEIMKIDSHIYLEENEFNFFKENFPLEKYGIPYCISQHVDELFDYLKYSPMKTLLTSVDIIEAKQETITDFKEKLQRINDLIIEKKFDVDKTITDIYQLNCLYRKLKDANLMYPEKMSKEDLKSTIKRYKDNGIYFPDCKYSSEDLENGLQAIFNNNGQSINVRLFFSSIFNMFCRYEQEPVLFIYKEQIYDFILQNNLLDLFFESSIFKRYNNNLDESSFYSYIFNKLITNVNDDMVSTALNQHLMNIDKDDLLFNDKNKLLLKEMIANGKLECFAYNTVFNKYDEEVCPGIEKIRQDSLSYLKENSNVNIITNGFNYQLRDEDLKDIVEQFDNPVLLRQHDVTNIFRLFDKDTTFKQNVIDKIRNSDSFAENFCSKSSFRKIEYKKYSEIFVALASKGGLFLSYFLNNIRNKNADFLFNKELYNNVKNDVCNELGYDLANIDLIAEKLGYDILKYLDEPMVQKVLKYDINKLEKIINILAVKSFDQHSLEAIYESIKQYEFELKNPDKTNIFTNLKHSLNDHNVLQISQILSELTSTFNDKLVFKLNDLYNAGLKSSEKNEVRLFLTKSVERILNNPQERHSLDALHEICNHYVMIKKEENAKTFNIEKDIDIDYVYDKRKASEFVALEFVENSVNFKKCEPLLFNLLCDIHSRLIKQVLTQDFLIKNDIKDASILNYDIDKVIKYFSSDNKEEYIKNEPQIFDYIKIAKVTMADLVNSKFLDQYYEMQNTSLDIIVNKLLKMPRKNENKVKVRQYRSFPEHKMNLYDILINLDQSKLNNIISNPEMYNSLVKSLNKWSLLDLPEGVCDYINKMNICEFIDEYSIASFINCYEHFYEKEISKTDNVDSKTPNISVIKVLRNIDAYSAVSSVYSQVLGKDDFREIYTDDEPNRSSLPKGKRLEKSLKATCDLFYRDHVTIPTFDQEFTYNDKKLRVIVGNFTDPSNLSHGERTGSCMRIGGAGQSLYNFCLSNPNGFHVRFEDPETGKYISRVSGFRNGNTVFFNELRFSLDKKYSDEDVYEITKQTANKLIELSKSSSAPIENVIIHDDYVVKEMKQKSVYLNIESPSKGYHNFYHDIENIDVVLATTATDDPYVPINFDNQDVPMYEVQRGKIIESRSINELMNRIVRVHAVKQLLKKYEPENVIPMNFETGFIYGMANDDWYIYVDANKEIHFECIDTNARAKEEFEIAMDNFMNKYNNIFVDKVGDFDRD